MIDASTADGSLDLPGAAVRSPKQRLSARVHLPVILKCSALFAAAVLAGVLSLFLGAVELPASAVWQTLRGHGTDGMEFVVYTVRFPRTLTAAGVGACLGISGALFQRLARNPLASPDIIGFETGAATGALLAIIVFGGAGFAVGAGAVLMGLVTAIVVYLLAYKRGIHSYRLILVGIGLAAVLVAINDYLIIKADIFDAQRAIAWLIGSLNGRDWGHVQVVWLALLLLGPVSMLLGRHLALLEMGNDVAESLGVRAGRSQPAVMVCGVMLASIAVVVAGPIAFIALVAPQIAFRATGSAGLTILPAACTGAMLLTAADVLVRSLPIELPVGVVTALVGAPYLIWLFVRTARVRVQ